MAIQRRKSYISIALLTNIIIVII